MKKIIAILTIFFAMCCTSSVNAAAPVMSYKLPDGSWPSGANNYNPFGQWAVKMQASGAAYTGSYSLAPLIVGTLPGTVGSHYWGTPGVVGVQSYESQAYTQCYDGGGFGVIEFTVPAGWTSSTARISGVTSTPTSIAWNGVNIYKLNTAGTVAKEALNVGMLNVPTVNHEIDFDFQVPVIPGDRIMYRTSSTYGAAVNHLDNYVIVDNGSINIAVDNDAYVDEAASAVNYGSADKLVVAYNSQPSNLLHSSVFLQASTLVSQLAGHTSSDIFDAKLWVYQNERKICSGSIYYANAAWNESTVTWVNKPSVTDTGDNFSLTNEQGCWRSISITNEVKAWLAGTKANYGLLFQAETTFLGGVQSWHSSECTNTEQSPFLLDNNLKPFIQVRFSPESCAEALSLGYGVNADFNGDCKVNFVDLTSFVAKWLN